MRRNGCQHSKHYRRNTWQSFTTEISCCQGDQALSESLTPMLLQLFWLMEPKRGYKACWGTPNCPQYVKYKIKYQHFFYVHYVKKKKRLTSNWSTYRLTHRLCPWWALLTDLTTELGNFWTETAIVCVQSVTEWLVPNVPTRISIRTYKFRTTNKPLPPLRIYVPRNPRHPLAELWGSAGPSLRNTVLYLGLSHHSII